MITTGTYRGVVIDSRDPSGLNRIRVQVPQVMGESVSGWAWPAWSMDDMTVWPEDRFPEPGEGVWVRFESADRMAWIGSYGLPEPAGEDPDDAFDVTIVWTLPGLPYNTAAAVIGATGSVSSPSGTPNPAPVMSLWANDGEEKVPAPPVDAPEAEKWVWTKVGSGPVALDGSWSIPYTRTISTDPRYMVRFDGTGVFAPTDSDVRELVIPTVPTTVSWASGDPAWQAAKTLSGTVTSPEGIPKPARVDLMISSNGGAYTLAQSASANATTGAWSLSHTRTDSNPLDMKAVFLGHDSWLTGESAVKNYAKVTSQPVITWDLPSKNMVLGVALTISGTVTAPYGPPTPSTVQFQTKVSGGSWATRANPTIAADGSWSFSYTPDLQTADYRMSYTGTGIFLSATTATLSANIQYSTTTTVTSFPSTLTHGVSFTVSGTVKDSLSRDVTRGVVQLWYRAVTTGGGWTAWANSNAPDVTPNGTYTLSKPALGTVGGMEWKVMYKGDGGSFLASESAVTARGGGLAAITGLTKGTKTHTSAGISWTAISGATSYRIYRGVNSATPTSYTTTTATSYTNSGLSNSTTYGYQVGAEATDAGGTVVKGALAPQVKMNTGRPEARKSGSDSYTANCTASNSYRPDVGWGYIGDKPAQGYYSDSSRNYTGVMTYSGSAFRSAMTAEHGADILSHLTWNTAKVAVYRVAGVGSGSAIACWWYVTSAVAGSGGAPSLAGGAGTGSLTPNTSAFIDLPYPHWAGHVLLNENVGGTGVVNSLALYRANSTEYAQYTGQSAGGNVLDLVVTFSWNFVTQSYVAPVWY